MSNTYEQLEHFAGCVNLILGGESMSLEQMVRKISGLKANNDYYTEWDCLTQDVEDLAECAGIDISDCESPNRVCALVLAEMKKRLMPDGCEWPRFDDGLPVHLGDEIAWGGDFPSAEVRGITLDQHGARLHKNQLTSGKPVRRGERVERPKDTWEKLQRDVASALKAEHCRVKDDAGLDRRAADLVARAKKLGGGANEAR